MSVTTPKQEHGEPRAKGCFVVGDRVRVKFGVDRGHYGTITHCGGDNGTYYGLKLDCHPTEIGYCEHELDRA